MNLKSGHTYVTFIELERQQYNYKVQTRNNCSVVAAKTIVVDSDPLTQKKKKKKWKLLTVSKEVEDHHEKCS